VDQEPSSSGTPVTDTQDPEQIKEQIEATREELGDTVEALAAKTDVKAQAKRKVEQTKASVAAKKDELLGKARETSPDAAVSTLSGASSKARENPLPVAVAGAFVLGFVAGRLTRG
jgi:transcriptional regulator with XRE-family HTH domain